MSNVSGRSIYNHPFFTPDSFTTFRFHAPLKFTLLNLRSLIFGLTPFVWLCSNTLTIITYFILHRAVSLRRLLILSQTRNSPHFMIPAFHCRVLKCSSSVPLLSQINPVQALTSHFLKIHLNIIFPCTTGSCKSSLSLRFPYQNPVYISPLPIRALFPSNLILLYLITRTILGEEYISLTSSFYNFLHSPVTSTLLGPNILLNNLSSYTHSLRCSHIERPSFTPIQNKKQNYNSVHINIYIFR
jgi:hypothetical protein